MSAAVLLQHIQRQGVWLKLTAEGRLIGGPKAAMTPELFGLIKANKPALIEALRAPTAESAPDPADVAEFYEERAGILEHDAGMTRKEAETEALRLTVVRFKLHQGEGGGTVIAPSNILAEVLAGLEGRYGDRLAEVEQSKPEGTP
jgi:hypothetical protein